MDFTVVGIIVIIFLMILFFIIWIIHEKIKLKRLRKKYNEDDDKSKQGEERRESGSFPRIAETKPPLKGFVEPQRDSVLPPTETGVDGETGTRSGKTDKLTNFFERLRKG